MPYCAWAAPPQAMRQTIASFNLIDISLHHSCACVRDGHPPRLSGGRHEKNPARNTETCPGVICGWSAPSFVPDSMAFRSLVRQRETGKTTSFPSRLGRSGPTTADHDDSEFIVAPLGKSRTVSSGQEQSKMMISAKGTATPRAPPIINTNAESKFSSARNSDITLLH